MDCREIQAKDVGSERQIPETVTRFIDTAIKLDGFTD
jgi:hypothetical protein